jgi:glyoxylase-like metal-dependent hydrolase (beta-lactamase superfamily II)
LVRRIVAPNPGLMTGPGTNTYLIGVDEIVVVDPGPADAAHLDAIVGCGGDRIRWIAVTHTHPDHAPGVAGLKARTGAEVLGYEARDGFVPDTEIGEGFELEGTEFRLQAVYTPGHASNHLCYLLLNERMLLSGDHVMEGSTVVISPPDGDMAVYLDSLRRLLSLRLRSIAPGHGQPIEDPDAYVTAYLDHRAAREQEIVDALAAGLTTIDAVVARVYADVAEELHPVARRTVHAHLRKLAQEGRVRGDDADGPWALAASTGRRRASSA